MDGEHSNQSHWIPLADLMTGLMMVFMLLTAAFMLRVEQTTTLVVKEYEETKREMNDHLGIVFHQLTNNCLIGEIILSSPITLIWTK